jgi:hypothetical protein
VPISALRVGSSEAVSYSEEVRIRSGLGPMYGILARSSEYELAEAHLVPVNLLRSSPPTTLIAQGALEAI